MRSGVELLGEPDAEPDHGDLVALQAWNLLATGMGGFDWQGLPLVVALLGVQDIELLLHRLQVIKTHKPPKGGE